MSIGETNINIPPILQDRRVQIGIGAVILIIIITVIIFSSMSASKSLGSFKLLLKGMDQIKAIEIASYLKTADIEYELIQGETGGTNISVREKQYDDAVLRLAGNQIIQADDLKLFNKSDWAASDEERRVKLIRALSGEASRIISRLDGVKSATAYINIPAKKMFKSNKDIASANVSLQMEAGRVLNDEQINSIISIIRGYYAEIEANHIAISDQKRVYSEITNDENASSLKSSAFSAERTNIETRVQEYLDSLFGRGKSTATVSISIETAKVSKNNMRFSSGAIGSHEYAEEAVGNRAINSLNYYNNSFETTKDLPEEEMQRLEAEKEREKQQRGYYCADDDEACKARDYRSQNFAIKSFPSYEEMKVEEPSGYIRDIKVSVIVNEEDIPVSTTISQLKRAIAAATDPSMSPSNVEIIIKPKPFNQIEEKKGIFDFFKKKAQTTDGSEKEINSKSSGFSWLNFFFITAGILFVFLLFIKAMSGINKPTQNTNQKENELPNYLKNFQSHSERFTGVRSTEQEQTQEQIPVQQSPQKTIEEEFDEEELFETEEELPQIETPKKRDFKFIKNISKQEEQEQRAELERKEGVSQKQEPKKKRPKIIIQDD